MKNYTFVFTFLFLTIFSNGLFGHSPDQSIIFMRIYENGMAGRYEMEVKDINSVLGTNLDKGFDAEDVTPFLPRIKQYFLDNSNFKSSQGVHEVVFNDNLEILDLELGTFVILDFELTNASPVPDAVDITYTGVFDKAPNHQGVLVIEYNWKAGVYNNESLISLVFTPSSTIQTLDLRDASVMKGFLNMVWMGIWHIFIGIDHILFLLALVLPAVVLLLKKGEPKVYNAAYAPGLGKVDNWKPVGKFKPAFIYVVTIITFFTISHCITLSLAALDIFNLPSRLVETLIAFSIALAAWHNIKPIFKKDWMIAFGFGLFHGFGFASVLGDLGLTGEYMVLSLLGFNLGVEIGQLAIIAVVFPILFFLRNTKYYGQILVYGSLLLIVISLYWMIERGFDIDMPVDDAIADFVDRVIKKLKYWFG